MLTALFSVIKQSVKSHVPLVLVCDIPVYDHLLHILHFSVCMSCTFSSSQKRLQKELQALQKDPPKGITVDTDKISDNLSE